MGRKASHNWSQASFSGKVQILLIIIRKLSGGGGLNNTEVMTNLSRNTGGKIRV